MHQIILKLKYVYKLVVVEYVNNQIFFLFDFIFLICFKRNFLFWNLVEFDRFYVLTWNFGFTVKIENF